MYFIVPQMTGHYIQRDLSSYLRQMRKKTVSLRVMGDKAHTIEKLNSLTKILAVQLSKTSSSDAEMWRPKLLLIVLFQVS